MTTAIIGPRIGYNAPPITDLARRARLQAFIERQHSAAAILTAEFNALHERARRNAAAMAKHRLMRAEGVTAYFPSRLQHNGRLRRVLATYEDQALQDELATFAPQLNRLERKLGRIRRSIDTATRDVVALTAALGEPVR
jgi:hypothetical protein